MSNLLQKIYEEVIQHECVAVEMSKRVEAWVDILTVPYKEQLNDGQMEQLRNLMYSTAIRAGHGRKFCVSVLRQNQEWHEINVHTWGRYPLTNPVPGGWMVCAPQAA